MKKPSIGRTNIVPTSNAETVREFYRRQGEQRELARIIAILEQWAVKPLIIEEVKKGQNV
jgi:hypothetical protein